MEWSISTLGAVNDGTCMSIVGTYIIHVNSQNFPSLISCKDELHTAQVVEL